MLVYRSIVMKGVRQVGVAVSMTFLVCIFVAGCAAPAAAPGTSPTAGSVTVEQIVLADSESDNTVIPYVVVDGSTELDDTLLESAYMLAPPSESLSHILEELGRTDTGNVGVLVPYGVGLDQGLNGSIVVQSTNTAMPDSLGTLTFANPLSTEFEDRSFLFEFGDNEALTATSTVDVDLNVFGSFSYTDTPDLGAILPMSVTIPGNWMDYCAEHPIECGGDQTDPQDICGCGYWWFDVWTQQWVWICIPCE